MKQMTDYVKNMSDIFTDRNKKDSWENLFTGVGKVNSDKRMSTVFNPNPGLTEDECNAIYRNEGMGRRIVEVLTEDMCRKWFKIEGDTDGSMEKAFDVFDGRTAIEEGVRWALLHGGSVGVLGIADGGSYEDPVNENDIDEITHIHVFDRWRTVWVTSDLYQDPYNPKFATPEYYTIFPINPAMSPGKQVSKSFTQTKQGRTPGFSSGDMPALTNLKGSMAPLVGAFRVHESRIIRFDGVLIPLKERIRNRYWNDSYLQSCYERIRGLGESYAGLETIIQEFIIGTMQIEDLANMVATGKEQLAIKRLDMLDRSKHIMNTLLLDKEEEYTRHSAAVSGLDGLVASLVLGISAASGIPVTILMGQSPAGLNATGASDVRRYYDKIAGMQMSMLKKPLAKLCRYTMLAKKTVFKGKILDNWSVKFPSLWALDEVQESELRLQMAQSDALYLDRGVLKPVEVSNSRWGGEQYSFETTLQDRDAKGNLSDEDKDEILKMRTPSPGEKSPDLDKDKSSRGKDKTASKNKKAV
jgi:phage-related protein (TIGR01555 family)